MRTFSIGLAAAALTLAGAAAQADTPPDAPAAETHHCFSITDWQGWRASKSERDVLYIKVRMHDVYKVQLVDNEPFLDAPDMHLVSKTWGPDMVCNAHDLDLKLADFHGMQTPLFVKALTKLTPDEIKALPKEDQP
jgi:hypothetical protein